MKHDCNGCEACRDEATTPGRPVAGYALDLVDVVQGPPVDRDAITEVKPPEPRP